MRTSRFWIVAIIAVSLAVVYRFEPSSRGKSIRTILDRGLVGNEWSADANAVLPLVVAGTQYANAWQVNKPPRPDSVNLYLLASGVKDRKRLPIEVRPLLGNCSYIGENATIVCDSEFLADFLPQRGFGSRPGNLEKNVPLRERDRRTFLFWVLGHEVGHIIHGDKPAHFGDSTGMTKQVSSNSLDQERELKADEYCASKAVLAKRSLDLETFLLGLINLEIERKVGVVPVAGVGIHWDYTNKRVVRYLSAGTHPEYVIRGTRLLIATAHASGDEGLVNLATSFARHMRPGKQ